MSLADAPSPNAIAAGVAAAYAGEDARRSAWLTLVLKEGGTCRTCGAGVADRFLAVHPGACATCMKLGRGRPITFEARAGQAVPTPAPRASAIPEEPARPAEEDEMPKGVRSEPCSGCGSRGTRCKADCKKPVVVPVTRRPGVALLAAPGRAEAPRGGPTKAQILSVIEAETKRIADAPGSARIMPLKPTPEMSHRELVELRDAVNEELRRRLALAQDEIAELKAAIGAETE